MALLIPSKGLPDFKTTLSERSSIFSLIQTAIEKARSVMDPESSSFLFASTEKFTLLSRCANRNRSLGPHLEWERMRKSGEN